MTKKVFIVLFFLSLFLFPSPLLGKVSAATLQLDPASANIAVGQNFEVKVNVDIGGERVVAVDVFLLYDQIFLEFQEVKNSTFFPLVSKNTSQAGKVYISGLVDDLSKSKTGTGTVASVIFKTKKVGSTTLSFDCTSGLFTDSNILKNDQNVSDIIQCASNGKSILNIGNTGQNPTSTPTKASNPTATSVALQTPAKSPTPTNKVSSNPTATPALSITPAPSIIPTLTNTPFPSPSPFNTVVPTALPTITLTQLPRAGEAGPLLRSGAIAISLILVGGLIRLVIL